MFEKGNTATAACSFKHSSKLHFKLESASEVDTHLRAFAKGALPKAEKQKDIILLPLDALEQIEKAKRAIASKEKEAERARDAEMEALLQIETMQLQIAQDAAALSKEGKIEFARQKFTALLVETSNLQALFLAYEFFSRTGDLGSAQIAMEKWLTLCDSSESTSEKAIAYGNLGVLYKTRGEFDCAEEMYQKSLAINEALGRKEGMANDYGN